MGETRFRARGSCEGGKCPRRDGRPVFTALALPAVNSGETFYLTTRRGQQFNFLVLDDTEWVTAAERNAIFVAPQDAERLGLRGATECACGGKWGNSEVSTGSPTSHQARSRPIDRKPMS